MPTSLKLFIPSRCRGEMGRVFDSAFFFGLSSCSIKGLKGSGFPIGLYLYAAAVLTSGTFVSATLAPGALVSGACGSAAIDMDTDSHRTATETRRIRIT